VRLSERPIERTDFFVDTGDGARLRVREAHAGGLAADAPVVVLVHGIAAPLVPTYDLPIPGYSFLQILAERGLRAVALDHRNFGGSSRDPRMDAPPVKDGVLHSLDDSVEDIRAVVEACRRRWERAPIALFGSSRGAIQVLAAALQLDVSIAILNNPSSLCYLSGSKDGPLLAQMIEEREGAKRESSYVPYTAEYQRKRWKKLFGDGQTADASLQEAYIAACLDTDAVGSRQDPPVFRVPSEGFPTRVPLLPLAELRVPTVVVEAEHVPDEHVAAFLAAVPRGRARILRIRDSNHFTLRNEKRYELANIIEAAVFGRVAT